MVSWYADGGASGYTVVGNNTNVIDLSLPGLTQDIFKLASNGSVDTNGITRLQYDVGDANYRKTIDVIARLRYTSAEISAASGGFIGATAAFAPASAFAGLGRNPTPSEIVAAATVAFHTAVGGAAANTNYEISIPGFKPPVNQKWWVVVYGSRWTNGAGSGAVTPGSDTALGFFDSAGRAISLWTNRPPAAPTIKTPGAESVFGSGTLFDLAFTSNDADRVSTRLSKADSDLAGVQIQYAAQTTDGSAPVWMDLPVASKDLNPTIGQGWYIEGSIYRALADTKNGMFDFWINRTMKIRCGPTSVRTPGAGMLPEGAWLLRMRTFDYGHPFPRWKKPLGDESGQYNPDVYPSLNSSPWSNTLKITVSPQVPAPVPLSPAKGIALPDNKDVVLRWKYRNTTTPPNAQREREVRIRKANGDWVTLVSGNGSAAEYNVEAVPPPPPVAPTQYEPNGNFENGLTNGWLSLNAEGAVNQTNPALAHSGQRYFKANDTTALPATLYKKVSVVGSNDKFFTVDMWAKRPMANSLEQVTQIYFSDAADNTLGAVKTFAAPPGGGWYNIVVKNIEKPANATSLVILTNAVAPSSGLVTSDFGYDDVSVLGAPDPIPDLPVVYNPFVLETNTYYEWQVRVVDTANVASEWSDIAGFWVVPAPASGGAIPDPSTSIEGATLGCGSYTVSIYRRGGLIKVGDLDSISALSYNRVRDDISEAKVVVRNWSQDCGELLADLETWAYEVVIFRHTTAGTERAWEGPITLLTYDEQDHQVVIQAKDLMVVAYRRIVEQEMNDSGAAGGDTVTNRAARIMANVMAPDDPNLLEHLVVIASDDDPRQYRNMPSFSRYAFEEIDDMASNSGLDYTVVGRRVIFWGTRNRVGTLPEFRESDLGAKPIVSEYGMSMANRYSVSNGQGLHGEANRLNSQGKDPKYGLVDMLSSTWATEAGPEEGTYTEEAKETIRKSFAESAERSIASRYPAPVVVRVPDNTTLSPSAVVSFAHLVPGVIIPLRSNGLRKVSGNQKLDEVKVTVDAKGEKIAITLSPFNRNEVASEGLSEGEVAEQ